MAQLEHIEAIERRLWSAADTLRANSNYASNQYFLPVMGLIFLRHAYSRFLAVKETVEASLPKRGGKTRPLAKEDFSQRGAIFLRPKAQFDYLVSLPDSEDRAKALMDAMDSIEKDYETLRGVLPRTEYQELENDVLGQLLRTLNPDELKKVSGDVFGRIYEYFLTQFADQKAHDGGEFFTPVSLVSLIAHILDPQGGTVLDPACGSGGMFVQSARTVEEHGQSPTERLTFRGLEKNAITIRLAKMNLAVHGLEGDIQKAITYYEDPHELLGKADYVMANPPFNVDEIDADKVKTDPRLPFGLPGVNKKGKVSNGNYVWISYFYSYLNQKGRAGFVMSSQASNAGRDEAKVRQKLVETGDVDIITAIRSNFFYTRTVPCELWFLNRAKPKDRRDKVLMLDARSIYRKVTRKIYDFSPEQQNNILAIIRLYRGEDEGFVDLVASYCQRTLDEAAECLKGSDGADNAGELLGAFAASASALREAARSASKATTTGSSAGEAAVAFEEAMARYSSGVTAFRATVGEQQKQWGKNRITRGSLEERVAGLAPLADSSHELVKQAEAVHKSACQLSDTTENGRSGGRGWPNRDVARARKTADEARQLVVEQLRQVRYFWRQAHWLTDRFPGAKLRDVQGLVKLVDRTEIEANDWSLSPGRYVGVAPEDQDEDFDFKQAMRDIHMELTGLDTEAAGLMQKIQSNLRELGA
ncbi:MAG: N-6 DNA methylase [Armatimonadetes bacterium]|nr:N-6 DNA methylase [Armatimonadota bacterium]